MRRAAVLRNPTVGRAALSTKEEESAVPRFKKFTFTSARNQAGATESVDVTINVDASGCFYANIPDYLRGAFNEGLIVRGTDRSPAGTFKARSETLVALEEAIRCALEAYATPEVTEEPVIRYNIESHVAFAVDESGMIVPNAGFPGASWVQGQKWLRTDEAPAPNYGDHHATNSARNGYSLAIGARAMLKRTYRFGTKTRVEYQNYYRGGSHLDHDNPANLLNSWCAVGLGDAPKEIPYSDDAALFFHRMLLSMAELSRRVQEATFTPQRLQALIAEQPKHSLLGFVPGQVPE